ncbi:MAG: reverse transcriptase-like protein [Candidatus Magasanikbacteria bacterium]|nr:reverse transcriptase-like protein [Candidatus Magasanikbacteria bacterium]
MKLFLYTDGGSRGNPGPSATGIVLKDESKKIVSAYGEFLGIQTNNFAEYSAIISGLKKAKALGATEVDCLADSKLVIEQLSGRWKVKHPAIQKLFVQAYNVASEFKKVTYKHIRREFNKEADAEVNKILDAQ